MAFKHTISDSCIGEKCHICGHEATHKVGECDACASTKRHPFTTNLCCWHFGVIMGQAALNWCKQKGTKDAE